ncbi:hypothetical protein HYH03_002841 [Edaphochlamys debaryana]|uniref:Guanylate cyclase domain-containing protein n=1 Tax=Edaphochlamys debaryana TaxID=47281 RepID=A0A835YAT7_9CHLO|nr:hypothetical protein HYH03_002841 [Edaphochlamys debaryana]|eukprot:KAG2499263.1 hypothetical protein HYH03_002841 [Edaphochlamys debaryana]
MQRLQEVAGPQAMKELERLANLEGNITQHWETGQALRGASRGPHTVTLDVLRCTFDAQPPVGASPAKTSVRSQGFRGLFACLRPHTVCAGDDYPPPMPTRVLGSLLVRLSLQHTCTQQQPSPPSPSPAGSGPATRQARPKGPGVEPDSGAGADAAAWLSEVAWEGLPACVTVFTADGAVVSQNAASKTYYGDLVDLVARRELPPPPQRPAPGQSSQSSASSPAPEAAEGSSVWMPLPTPQAVGVVEGLAGVMHCRAISGGSQCQCEGKRVNDDVLGRLFARDPSKLEQLLQATQLLGPTPECRAWEGIVRVAATLDPCGQVSSTVGSPEATPRPSHGRDVPPPQPHGFAPLTPVVAGGGEASVGTYASALLAGDLKVSCGGSDGDSFCYSQEPRAEITAAQVAEEFSLGDQGGAGDRDPPIHTSTVALDVACMPRTASFQSASSGPDGQPSLAAQARGQGSAECTPTAVHGLTTALLERPPLRWLDRPCASWGSGDAAAAALPPTSAGGSAEQALAQASAKLRLRASLDSRFMPSPSLDPQPKTTPGSQPGPSPSPINNTFLASSALLDTAISLLGTDSAEVCASGPSTLRGTSRAPYTGTSRLSSTQRFTSLDAMATSTWALLMPAGSEGGDGRDQPLCTTEPQSSRATPPLRRSHSTGGPALDAADPEGAIEAAVGGLGGDEPGATHEPTAAGAQADQLGPLLSGVPSASTARRGRSPCCLVSRSCKSFTGPTQRQGTTLAGGGLPSAGATAAAQRPPHRLAAQEVAHSLLQPSRIRTAPMGAAADCVGGAEQLADRLALPAPMPLHSVVEGGGQCAQSSGHWRGMAAGTSASPGEGPSTPTIPAATPMMSGLGQPAAVASPMAALLSLPCEGRVEPPQGDGLARPQSEAAIRGGGVRALQAPPAVATSPRLLQFATSLCTAPVSMQHTSSRVWGRRSSILTDRVAGSLPSDLISEPQETPPYPQAIMQPPDVPSSPTLGADGAQRAPYKVSKSVAPCTDQSYPPEEQQQQQQVAIAAQESGPAQQGADLLAWHEVRAAAVVDPCSGARLLVVMQKDVTAKVEAERHIAQVSETEHRLLEQVFPRHVLAYMTEQGFDQPQPQPLQPALSAAADGSAQLNPAWRPCVRDCTQLATWHPQVTVLFADIQGFTPMCKELPAAVVMKFLNDLFVRFDSLLDAYGVYKVETIGDCYVVAGGLIGQDADGMAAVQGGGESDPQQADRVFGFAQAMLRAAAGVTLPTTGEPVRIRVGIHSGAVVSGVVGTRMPRFCLFGDTVNTASRMESTSRAGCIHVSNDTFVQLSSQQRPGWAPTGGVEVKGKGLMETFMWSQLT